MNEVQALKAAAAALNKKAQEAKKKEREVTTVHSADLALCFVS